MLYCRLLIVCLEHEKKAIPPSNNNNAHILTDMIPVGTLLQIDERRHTYRIIVLERFPVFFDRKKVWHYNLHFWRDGWDMGTLAFEEKELSKLINSGEIKILSEG
tara:strand:- start:242 stop:556 length:315 start_codon:yes stop_codon:yes gene_type:complete